MGLLDPPGTDFRGNPLRSLDPRRDLPALIGWWDASTLTDAAGTAVAALDDRSGGGNRAIQSTPSARPTVSAIGGKRALAFSGSQWLAASQMAAGTPFQPSAWSQPLTYVAVVKPDTSGAAAARLILGANVSLFVQGPTLAAGVNGGSVLSGGPRVDDGAAHVIVAVFHTGSCSIFVDGWLVAHRPSQAGSNTLTTLGLGATPGGGNPYTGLIGEAMVFAGPLNGDQVTRLTSSLQAKWGITPSSAPAPQLVANAWYQDLTDSAGVNLRLWLPAKPQATMPLLVWSHPSDHTEQFNPDYFAWPLVYACVNAGIGFVATRQHGNSWGNASAITDLENALAAVNSITSVGKVILAGGSMGGIATALAPIKSSILTGSKIACRITFDAVADIFTLYSQASYTSAIDTAWAASRGTLSAGAAVGATSLSSSLSYAVGTTVLVGNGTANVERVTVSAVSGSSAPYTLTVSGTTKAHSSGDQISDLPAKVAGSNPAELAGTALATTPWRLYASPNDATVPISANAQAVASKYGGVSGAPECTVVQHLGGHLGATVLPTADVMAFIRRSL